jgi:hypothetical protein
VLSFVAHHGPAVAADQQESAGCPDLAGSSFGFVNDLAAVGRNAPLRTSHKKFRPGFVGDIYGTTMFHRDPTMPTRHREQPPLAKRVTLLRQLHYITQEELAKRAVKLADALGVTLDELVRAA